MYYAVKIGRNPGVYETWIEAEKQVTGYSGAKYKSFKELSDALEWIKDIKKKVPIPDIAHENSELIIDYSKSNIHAIIYAINSAKILHDGLTVNTWTEYEDSYYIFTDGSFKKSNNKSGSGIYFGPSVSIKLPDGFTNNQAELIAILYALVHVKVNLDTIIKNAKSVIIVSDSMYCINTVTKWMTAWEKNNWKKANGDAILNPELIQSINMVWKLLKTTQVSKKTKISFMHQRSHTTAPPTTDKYKYMLWHGNQMSDKLASNT